MKSSALFSLLLAIPRLGAGAEPQLDLGQLQGWSIVVAADAIPSEKYAAEEFQGLLEQAVGIRLPIRATPPEPAHNIFIGPSASLASSSVSIESGDLGDEGLRIRIGADNLAIVGGRPRGTCSSDQIVRLI